MTGLLIYINDLNPHKVGIPVPILQGRTCVQNTDVLLGGVAGTCAPCSEGRC